MTWTTHLDSHFRRLLDGGDDGLDGGAELEVFHPDGARAFLAPLARHYRYDPEVSDGQRACVWIRPLVGGYPINPRQPGEPTYAFDLDEARRRNLTFTRCWQDGDTLVFDLDSGQRAYVRPIRSQLLAELQRWDTFYLLYLDAADQARLDALDSDPG